MQLSWCIYDQTGRLIKESDYYVNNPGFSSSGPALKIHGISEEFRMARGSDRADILRLFNADLEHYEPMLVGHFIELDLHVIGAECYRAGLENAAAGLPCFCTMKATTQYVRNPAVNHLRLNELYVTLFNTKMPQLHNALYDAKATAECFFELWKRGDIDEVKLSDQQLARPASQRSQRNAYIIPAFIVLVIFFIFSML